MQELTPESVTANRFQLVSRLADDLAHEIKNPLNSMVINVEVLRSRARKSDMEGVLERATVLETEILRLNGLIDGLLKLMRPGRAGTTDFAMDSLLEELGSLVVLQAKLSRKDVVVTPIGETAMIRAPRDAVRFALLNVMSGELQAANGNEARVEVGGTTDRTGTTVRIESHSGKHADEDGHRDQAIEMARSLLAPIGGSVDVEKKSRNAGSRVLLIKLPLPASA